MPNYYSDGNDWYILSDDSAKAKLEAAACVSATTYAGMLSAISTVDSSVKQVKPSAQFTKK